MEQMMVLYILYALCAALLMVLVVALWLERMTRHLLEDVYQLIRLEESEAASNLEKTTHADGLIPYAEAAGAYDMASRIREGVEAVLRGKHGLKQKTQANAKKEAQA